MSNSTQCVNVPPGASGSSAISAKLCAAGAPSQRSGGETSAPSQVYVAGIAAPSANAVLVSVKVTGAPPVVLASGAGAAGAAPPQPKRQPIAAMNAPNRKISRKQRNFSITPT